MYHEEEEGNSSSHDISSFSEETGTSPDDEEELKRSSEALGNEIQKAGCSVFTKRKPLSEFIHENCSHPRVCELYLEAKLLALAANISQTFTDERIDYFESPSEESDDETHTTTSSISAYAKQAKGKRTISERVPVFPLQDHADISSPPSSPDMEIEECSMKLKTSDWIKQVISMFRINSGTSVIIPESNTTSNKFTH